MAFKPSFKTLNVVDTAAEAAKRAQIAEAYAARQAEQQAAQSVERAGLSSTGESFSNPPRLEGDVSTLPTERPSNVSEEVTSKPSVEENSTSSEVLDPYDTSTPYEKPVPQETIRSEGKPGEVAYDSEAPYSKEGIEEVLKNGTPEQKQSYLQWLKDNKGKATAGVLGVGGLAAYAMSGKEDSKAPVSTQPPSGAKKAVAAPPARKELS